MPSTKLHDNWKRTRLSFAVEDSDNGWIVKLIASDETWELGIPFATEESATKAGQAILDYSYGPDQNKTTEKFKSGSKTKIADVAKAVQSATGK